MNDRLLKESDVMRAIDKRVEELWGYPEFVRKKGYIDVLGVKKHILDIPSADRPQGEWIDCGSYYKCPFCEEIELENDGKTNFCPNCGSKMRGEHND